MWQERLAKALLAYQDELSNISLRQGLYEGSRDIYGPRQNLSPKKASNVRNLVYELLESQVDSSIPQPKVTARNEGDQPLAQMIEDMLRSELDRLPMEELNDLDERTTYIQGGDFFLLGWDNEGGTHASLGEVQLQILHPRQVIPQPGVTNLAQADYWFVRQAKTKNAILKKYGVNVQAQGEEDSTLRGDEQPAAEDLVTHNTAFYYNEAGKLSLFSWVNDTVIEQIDDFLARKTGTESQQYEELTQDIYSQSGQLLVPAMTDRVKSLPMYEPDGSMYVGQVVETAPTRVPCYVPKVLPVILRRNVSAPDRLLGASDVDNIADQQQAVKKLGTKIDEKLLKGGSYITLPEGVNVDQTNEELKVLRLENAAQKALVDVYTVQPDISKDLAMIEQNYEWARSTLGITDSYQGKRDVTATSGVAKQFAASQAAGRLESKRVMKNAAYQRLFEGIFQFMLAYADEPRPVKSRDEMGNTIYKTFDRHLFLKQDDAGEWYWNDEFLFGVDTTGGLAGDRKALWKEATEKFSSGAMGDPSDPNTLILYWTLLEQLHYPMAQTIRARLAQKQQEAELQAAMQQDTLQQAGTQPTGTPDDLLAQAGLNGL